MAFSGPSSRFKLSDPVMSADGHPTYGIMKKFKFLDPEQVGSRYIKFEVSPRFAFRPDKIAESVYNRPGFGWVVIMFNKPKNPFDWPEIGDIIKLPSPTLVIPNL